MTKASGNWRKVCRPLQLGLTFGLTLGHGVFIGKYDVGFHPIYRLRQTLAIAISRMQIPPSHGYLAPNRSSMRLTKMDLAFFPTIKACSSVSKARPSYSPIR
jgi:hypothetical protein